MIILVMLSGAHFCRFGSYRIVACTVMFSKRIKRNQIKMNSDLPKKRYTYIGIVDLFIWGELLMKTKHMKSYKTQIMTRLLYLWKRIRDAKIKTKLFVYLILVAITCSITIGCISYFSLKSALIDNARESAISLLKQIGTRVDNKIQEYQDASFTLMNRTEILEILTDTNTEKTQWEHTLNETKFNNNLLFQDSLYKNSDYAVLESENQEVYIYNQVESKNKINNTDARKLLDELRSEVSVSRPVQWIKIGNRVYFVRRATQVGKNREVQEIGLMVFALKEEFFEFGDDSNPYACNKNMLLAGADGVLYSNQTSDLGSVDLGTYLAYNQGKYHVYATSDQIAGKTYLIIPLRTVMKNWNIICFIPYSLILEQANRVIIQVVVTMFILLCAGILIANLFYRMIKKNLEIIESGMKEYETGNYSKLNKPAYYDEIGMLILQFNRMGMKINELNENALIEQKEKQNLQYQVMEAQVNPHFLYNTLGALKWLAYEKDQEDIADFADAIIELLRFTVKNVNKYITLQQEIDYIKHYAYIQKSRYDNAFEIEYSITREAQNFIVIGFILQPFVENSIIHGLDNSKKDGRIRISGDIQNDKLHLVIQDNGVGISREKLLELKQKIEAKELVEYKGFNGIGITNIVLRLKSIYGDNFEFEMNSVIGEGTTAAFLIPRGGECK